MSEPQQQDPMVPEVPYSARFVEMVRQQFLSELSDELAFTDYEKTLAQHMFLKVDTALREFEAKRLEDGNNRKTPFTWSNVNLERLALDTVHRSGLGLDALLPNHIHPVPYWNARLTKYDLDLRVGYMGKDLCARTMALDQPIDVVYHLVHDSDEFTPRPRSKDNPVDDYEFEITKPFDRGDVIGGFGYVIFDNPLKNRLILVTRRDFERAESAAQTSKFWKDNRLEMQFKTVVHRVCASIPIDPRRVNAKSYAYVAAQEERLPVEEEMAGRMADEANLGEVIEIDPVVDTDGDDNEKPCNPECDF